MKIEPEILRAAEWLQSIAEDNPYAEAGIKIYLHGGHIVRVEQSKTVKIKPVYNEDSNDKSTW